MNWHDEGLLSVQTGAAAAGVPVYASVCSLIRVCRKLSLIVSDDVVRVIREARVGVSVKCNASVKEKKRKKKKPNDLLSLIG